MTLVQPSPARPVRIVLVDDHRMLIDLMAFRMDSDPEMEVVGTATDCDEGVRLITETRPDVAVFDVEMPGRGAFDAVSDLASAASETRIVFLTGYLSDVYVSQALRLNAAGYLMKAEPIDVLIEALKRVGHGGYSFSREVEDRLRYNKSRHRFELRMDCELASLTGRQLEVLRHLSRGLSVKEIARRMHLSQKSVDSHKYRIMSKLGIHDRVELARYAIREGLTLP